MADIKQAEFFTLLRALFWIVTIGEKNLQNFGAQSLNVFHRMWVLIH